ncbi:lysostaphin resistance A-like protein [Arthrobacter sp. NPDC092385]|uniref:CPBP family intramembrane glutamic endopeptidase n=1 Tax=Arthrobacter sp. NPDC092385 TaxID=3363943 RepID=UPI00380CA7CA
MKTWGNTGRATASGIVIGGAVLWLLSLISLIVTSPSGTEISSDPSAQAVPYWVTLTPLAVGIALTLILPGSSSPLRPVEVSSWKSFRVTTTGLVVLAVLFPLATVAVPLMGEAYVLGKLVLFVIVPAILLLVVRGSVSITGRRDSSRWWAPAIVIVVWTLLSQVAPWNPVFDPVGFDMAFILTAAIATAITAGVGEELFYRRWLQTRLEALLGAWPGIVMTSLAFALMHLGSHGTGAPLVDLARVIVVQGSFGLFVGVMWWRYRNLTAIITVHIISNGWAVAAALLR